MRLFSLTIFALTYLGTCGAANAQQGIKTASTDPYEKQLTVEFTNGTTAVADYQTKFVYLSTRSGHVYEVPFSQAVASKESDPKKRQQMLATFQASLVDIEHLATIRAPRIATDDSVWPKVTQCGYTICIEPFSPHAAGKSVPASSQSIDCDFKCLPDPCTAGPCTPNKWGSAFFYSGFGAGWDQNEGGGGVQQQEIIAYDKQRFESERNAACGDKIIAAAETSVTGAATVAACATIETGLGVLPCAGGIVLYGIGLHKTNKANKECQAAYPGPGNW